MEDVADMKRLETEEARDTQEGQKVQEIQEVQEALRRSFCWKLGCELKLMKHRMLKRKKEAIYASAYEIDHKISIYEAMVELSQRLGREEMQRCKGVPELLALLYGEWLKVPDSSNEELEDFLRSFLWNIENGVA